MSNFMHYKGYDASVEFSDENNVLFGKVEGIRSLISFEGNDVISLRKAFQESIDDYLEICKKEKWNQKNPIKAPLI